MKWYELIKSLMAQKKLKQDDLIAVFGVTTRGAVGHYMTGRRTPTPEQLKAVANKFEISLDRLMDNIPANSERLTVLYGQIEKLTDVQRSAVEQMVDVLMKSNTENKIENTSPSPENKPLTNKAPNAGGGD